MMFYPLALLGGIALFSSAAAHSAEAVKVFEVQVSDQAGDLFFAPPITNAKPGDFVLFKFNPKNHTVTQSSLQEPCTPLKGGFDSGFLPVGAGDNAQPVFTIQVNDSSPIWIHCRQNANTAASHCGNGMVAAINPGPNGSNTSFPTFLRNSLNTVQPLSAPSTSPATSLSSKPPSSTKAY